MSTPRSPPVCHSEITLRPALASDIPTLADIATEVFFHAPIDLQFFPRHFFHPVEYRAFFLREFQIRLASPNQIVMVAEVGSPGPSKLHSESKIDNNFISTLIGNVRKKVELLRLKEKEERIRGWKGVKGGRMESRADGIESVANEIVGYAAWMRFGSFPHTYHRDIWPRDSPFKALSRMFLHASGLLSFLTIHIQSVRVIRSFHLQAESIISSLKLESWVDLSALGVKVNWQRRSVGGRLVDWGLSKADNEGMACVLEATENGLELYERRGFRKVGEVALMRREVTFRRKGWVSKRSKEIMNVGEVRMPVMLREARRPDVRDDG